MASGETKPPSKTSPAYFRPRCPSIRQLHSSLHIPAIGFRKSRRGRIEGAVGFFGHGLELTRNGRFIRHLDRDQQGIRRRFLLNGGTVAAERALPHIRVSTPKNQSLRTMPRLGFEKLAEDKELYTALSISVAAAR